MKDFIGKWCAWYLNRKNRKQQAQQQKLNDEKLKEVYIRLKQLESFVKFLHEKVLLSRRERKSFWRAVEHGQPVIEDILKKLLERYGVKKETMEELERRKQENIKKQAELAKTKQRIAKERKIIDNLPYIKNRKCQNQGEHECHLGYACDGCPYNPEKKATKKQLKDNEK